MSPVASSSAIFAGLLAPGNGRQRCGKVFECAIFAGMLAPGDGRQRCGKVFECVDQNGYGLQVSSEGVTAADARATATSWP